MSKFLACLKIFQIVVVIDKDLLTNHLPLVHGPPSCHVQQFSIAPIEGKHNNNPAKKIALTLHYLRQTSIKKAKRLA